MGISSQTFYLYRTAKKDRKVYF